MRSHHVKKIQARAWNRKIALVGEYEDGKRRVCARSEESENPQDATTLKEGRRN